MSLLSFPKKPHLVNMSTLGKDQFRSLNADPQILFTLKTFGQEPLWIGLLAQHDNVLTPRLYCDWGHGFTEDASFGYSPARAAELYIDFTHCPDLRAFRLDPLEGQAEFVFQYTRQPPLPWEAPFKSLEAARAPLLRATFKTADLAPQSQTRAFGRLRQPRTKAEMFLHTCRLAEGISLPAIEAPLISFICPVYNTKPDYLEALLASFVRQSAGVAELILVDDASTSKATLAWLSRHTTIPHVRIIHNKQRGGIAVTTNAGTQQAQGRFLGFIDHDDALSPNAIAVIARAICDHPQTPLFYTDEAIADANLQIVDIFDKPAFDDVLLSGVNYINHLCLYRRDLFSSLGGFRAGYDGSQDYDLLLRACQRIPRNAVRHIPYPAYIWRRDGASYSATHLQQATHNARHALGEAYSSPVEAALLPDLHRVQLVHTQPKVSIIIPNRDSFRMMHNLTEGLFKGTDYPDFEVIVVDNGTQDPDTLQLYERWRQRDNVVVSIQPVPFHFSAQVNRGFALAKGDVYLLLNNDIEILTPDWLTEMISCLSFADVGIVGARLLYPKGTLQHAGVIVGLGGLAGHWFQDQPKDYAGMQGRLAVRSSLSAVTGACMLITRPCLETTGPFDEEHFAIAYNDIDFCLRARKAGFRTVYTPFATLTHHESISRGRDDKGASHIRFLREQAMLLERHSTDTFLDPALSPWHNRTHCEPSRIALQTLPQVR